MKMQETAEEIKEGKLIYARANQAIKDIEDRMETLNKHREYQKGLRDAAYAILNVMGETKKGGED